MIARTVSLQRPHSEPAPQASAICLEVDAPDATRSVTVWLVTPVQRQTNIRRPSPSSTSVRRVGGGMAVS